MDSGISRVLLGAGTRRRGLAAIGAGIGIDLSAFLAAEGTARQPAAGGDIRTNMIISAALIEGVALFAEVICIILANK